MSSLDKGSIKISAPGADGKVRTFTLGELMETAPAITDDFSDYPDDIARQFKTLTDDGRERMAAGALSLKPRSTYG